MARGPLADYKSEPCRKSAVGACTSQDRAGAQGKFGGGRGGTRTVPCASGECAWVDEEVLAIVEQAHSCYEGLVCLSSYLVRDGEHLPKVPNPAAVAAVP